jgi:regulator of protease activity HflC (stomatin/prohibitin superfamily)
MALAELLIGIVIAFLIILVVVLSVRVVPQARARNVERLGRYRKTLQPGMNFIIPFVDRVKPLIDLREQVVSFKGQPVITEDNLVVLIDTVLFFQVTDPRAADYEIVDYIQAIEQLTATMLRSVIGSMDLEDTLTSRDRINNMLRGVLDDASGKWGIRVTRVEIKAIDPPKSVVDAMEKQMRAEREKRAAILNAEGVKQSKILTAEGEKQGNILTAEGAKQSAILRAEGQAQAIDAVFQAVHRNDPDPKLLAYQYLQMLPQLAQGQGSTFWVIPSEVTSALKAVTSAFDGSSGAGKTSASTASPAADAVADAQPAPAVAGPVPVPSALISGDGDPAPEQAGLTAEQSALPPEQPGVSLSDVASAVSAALAGAIPAADTAATLPNGDPKVNVHDRERYRLASPGLWPGERPVQRRVPQLRSARSSTIALADPHGSTGTPSGNGERQEHAAPVRSLLG